MIEAYFFPSAASHGKTNLVNFSSLFVQGEISNITLLNDFDPTRVQDDENAFLPGGTNYTFGTIGLNYSS